jgi:hypothetical protein
MPTIVERQRLRMDMGFQPDDTVSMSDATIDAIFLEAGEYYTDPTSIAASTRVLSLRRLLMQAANEVDYTKNNSTERSSQRYDHLSKELARWQEILDYATALSGEGGAVRSGKPQQIPYHPREYPYGIFYANDWLI